MSFYATKGTFGKQRASVGREIVLCVEDDSDVNGRRAIIAGKVARIDPLSDSPIIHAADGNRYGGPHKPVVFADTATEADVNGLAVGMWSWPVRL